MVAEIRYHEICQKLKNLWNSVKWSLFSDLVTNRVSWSNVKKERIVGREQAGVEPGNEAIYECVILPHHKCAWWRMFVGGRSQWCLRTCPLVPPPSCQILPCVVCAVCIVCGIGFIHGTCLNSLYTSNTSFPLPPPPSPTSVLRALHVVSSPLVFWLCTAEWTGLGPGSLPLEL